MGTVFNCYDNSDKTVNEITRFSNKDAEAYSKFLAHCESLYAKTEQAFIKNPLYDISDLKNLNLPSFFGIDAFSTVSKSVDKVFHSPYMRMFFKRFTTYNGSSPYQAPCYSQCNSSCRIKSGRFLCSWRDV